MLTGLWNLQDFENSRQNRSKNKLVRKKGRDTSVWKLLVPGYGLLGVSSFNSGGERRSTYLILACSRCSDSRAPEKNSQRNIKEGRLFCLPPLPSPRFPGVHFNSLPNNRRALLSERPNLPSPVPCISHQLY